MSSEQVRQPTVTVPKLCGGDIELGNFVLGADGWNDSVYEASRALLAEVDGLPRRSWQPSLWDEGEMRYRAGSHSGPCSGYGGYSSSYGAYYSQDWGRKFLPANGGCIYVDLNHLELCLPEVTSAWDHVAAWHAMLRIARRAMEAANERRRDGHIQVLVNNSDGRGNSYGSHLDFLIARRAWENIFYRRLHYLLFLASYQVSSVVFTGQGKVGAENQAPETDYQLAQRADFFEVLYGTQTTYSRPIVNSRDEALCGHGAREREEYARLHVIFFDNTLAHTASLLKVGVMQILLAMIEAGRVDTRLMLEDPVEAVVRYSHDPTLEARASLASGGSFTAVELQLLFFEQASRFVSEGGCDGVVPRAAEIVSLWEDTLTRLRAGDFPALARRLDWVLKLAVLDRARRQRPELGWRSPQMKHLDHLYSSLDPAEGLYWIYERNGHTDQLVPESEIARLVDNPPEDTRAWGRAALLRLAHADEIDSVDWDSVGFRLRRRDGWTTYPKVYMTDPLGFSKAEAAPVLESLDSAGDVIEALEQEEQPPPAPVADNRLAHRYSWQN